MTCKKCADANFPPHGSDTSPVMGCRPCGWPDRTCWTCDHRAGEECDMFGHEVFPDSIPCDTWYPENAGGGE